MATLVAWAEEAVPLTWIATGTVVLLLSETEVLPLPSRAYPRDGGR